MAKIGALVGLSGLRRQRDPGVAEPGELAVGAAAAEVATVREFAEDNTAV